MSTRLATVSDHRARAAANRTASRTGSRMAGAAARDQAQRAAIADSVAFRAETFAPSQTALLVRINREICRKATAKVAAIAAGRGRRTPNAAAGNRKARRAT